MDLAAGSVFQDAREVQTKFSKSFTTYFFPVSKEARLIVDAWVTYLRQEKLWGNDDPLFPATLVELSAAKQFEAVGLARKQWTTASPIRAIFRSAFESASSRRWRWATTNSGGKRKWWVRRYCRPCVALACSAVKADGWTWPLGITARVW